MFCLKEGVKHGSKQGEEPTPVRLALACHCPCVVSQSHSVSLASNQLLSSPVTTTKDVQS